MSIQFKKSIFYKNVYEFSFRLEKQYAQEVEELKKKKADLWTVFYNLKKQRAETHSLWCHLHRTLTIADSVRREWV